MAYQSRNIRAFTVPKPQSGIITKMSRASRQAYIARARGQASVYGWGSVSNMGRSAHSAGYGRSASGELKSFDVIPQTCVLASWNALAAAEPGASTGFCELNDVQAGNAFYNRVGSKITMRSLQVKFTLEASAATVIGNVRWAIVYDRQPNGSFPGITDIFGVNGAGAGPNAGVNIQNRSRFLVLRDQSVSIDPAAQLTHNVEAYIKLPQLPVDYKASAATIGDISTGALYLIVGLLDLAGAGTVNLGNATCRLRYFD